MWEDQGEKDGGLGGGFSSRVTNEDLTEEEPASLLANLDPEHYVNENSVLVIHQGSIQ